MTDSDEWNATATPRGVPRLHRLFTRYRLDGLSEELKILLGGTLNWEANSTTGSHRWSMPEVQEATWLTGPTATDLEFLEAR